MPTRPLALSRDMIILCRPSTRAKLDKTRLNARNKTLDTTSPPRIRQTIQSKTYDHPSVILFYPYQNTNITSVLVSKSTWFR